MGGGGGVAVGTWNWGRGRLGGQWEAFEDVGVDVVLVTDGSELGCEAVPVLDGFEEDVDFYWNACQEGVEDSLLGVGVWR